MTIASTSRPAGSAKAARELGLLVLLLLSASAAAQSRLATTVHNLTPSGPGPMREATDAGLCVFCHTPHNAKPTKALWNRALPGVSYTLYQSPSMIAAPGQPTGASRLCLSCHDGLLAMGDVRVAPAGSRFTLGPLTGSASLGTDLSNDHPVSFVYDSALALRRGELTDPLTLPSTLPLENGRELQCSTCHDPHDDTRRPFLREDSRNARLCTSCHEKRFWLDASHATSPAAWNGSGTRPWGPHGFDTVAENACLNCHRPHAAAHPDWLLAQSVESENCTICHNGNVAQKNIANELMKFSHHPVENSPWVHEPGEQPSTMPVHVSCADCHNPHAATTGTSTDRLVSGVLRSVPGLSIAGVAIEESVYKYEICLKCHGTREPQTPGLLRVDSTRNIRLRIDPGNPSYHPVAAPGTNATIRGLKPQFTPTSQIDCTDCHNNDAWAPNGSAPRGPHGSRFEPILVREFQREDPSVESFADYALCYGCHDRGALLQKDSGGFPHRKHVVEEDASCAVCHDVHGSRINPFLIDFMRRTRLGRTVVQSNRDGRLEFVPAGPGHGSCFLKCHGEEHDPKTF